MEGGRNFDSCDDMLALLDSANNSLWVPPSSFHDTMVNFDQEPQGSRANAKRDRCESSFGRGYEGEDTGGEESDPNPQQSEKKRRLTADQVEFLEKSFENESKLDPERKEKLAKKLGLQSKQVAIWFQNRRARYKTKQIEKEFATLKASYDSLKYDYDSLSMEKEQLQNEVEILKMKLKEKKAKENNSNPKNIMHCKERMPIYKTYGHGNKQVEDASSAKSDVLDSESPQWTDGNQTYTVVESSSSLVRGRQSDISADDEEHYMMSKNLLLPQTPPTFNNFLKVADDHMNYDPIGSAYFSLLDNQPIWSWLYQPHI